MEIMTTRRRRINFTLRVLLLFSLVMAPIVLFFAAFGPFCVDLPPTEFAEIEVSIAPAYDQNSDDTAAKVHKRIEDSQVAGIIYLTFDDGPGPYTEKLLDILKKYNIKATFFVTGAGNDSLIKREYEDGHAIGLHTFSHNYSYIYSHVDNFFEDLSKIQNRVENITGIKTYLMRFPGGSSNTISARYKRGIMSSLVNMVEERGFTYFDWNVVSGDAGGTTSTAKVIENVTANLKHGGKSIVLQHDIKDFSVDAVEKIIEYGLKNHYKFDKLSKNSFTAHHGVNN